MVGAAAVGAATAVGMAGAESVRTAAASENEAPAAVDEVVEARKYAAKLNPQQTVERNVNASVEHIFTPWQFGKLELPNRIVKSAAGRRGMWTQGLDGPEPVAYYSRIAAGGAGMVFMDDIVEVYEHFTANPGVGKISDWTDDQFHTLIDAVHAGGAKFGYQLASMGLVFSGFVDTGALFASSRAADMSPEEVQLFIQDTASAAKKLQELGFDAVEINAAGENIGQSFLSRSRNLRDDEYGPQSIENRARFVCEQIRAIKAACGEDFPVQVLINGIEENDEDLGNNSLYTTVEENIEFAKLFEAAGADSLHVRIGPSGQHVAEFAGDLYFTGYGIDGATGYGTQFDFKRHWQGMLKADRSGLGVMVNVAAKIKQAVSIPVGTVTYMDPAMDPEWFDSLIADGTIDFMLMNRPLGVDPEYVHKLQEGRIDEIAPCTRCMHCHFDYNRNGELDPHCRVDAAGFRAYRDLMPEGFEPLPAEEPKNIMVIGGGPAGMEAARIAAKRGHTVTLYEKNGYLGGLLPYANAVKGQHENLGILRDYLERQLELAGVEVVLDTEVDAALVEEKAPDAVIVCVGGARRDLGLTSTETTNVVAFDDVIAADIANDVVVLGDRKSVV